MGLTGHKRDAACERARLSTVATRRRAKSSSGTHFSTASGPSNSVRATWNRDGGSVATAALLAASGTSMGYRTAGADGSDGAGAGGAATATSGGEVGLGGGGDEAWRHRRKPTAKAAISTAAP